jgi:hypothetical protein
MKDKDEEAKDKNYQDSPSKAHLISPKGEYNINEKAVKLQISFESSENFAKDVLNGFANSLKETAKQQRQIDYATRNLQQIGPKAEKVRLLPGKHIESLPINIADQLQNIRQESFPQNNLELPTGQNRKRILFIILLILIISLVAVAGYRYQNYKNNRALEETRHEMMMKKEKTYNYILAHYLNNLFGALDELTANAKMAKVFPEISSMLAIAKFKRGSDPAMQAKAAIEFIYRVKDIFDDWVSTAPYSTSGQKPDKKDIEDFLVKWRSTEKLLDQLKAAEQDPFIMLPGLQQLKKLN